MPEKDVWKIPASSYRYGRKIPASDYRYGGKILASNYKYGRKIPAGNHRYDGKILAIATTDTPENPSKSQNGCHSYFLHKEAVALW
jgi:hypothetical protein